MNTESLIRKAVTQLKLKWGLPHTGFIAGGSIANLVWSYVTDNDPVINDIDIFVNSTDDKQNIFVYKESNVEYTESYNHLRQTINIQEKYKIHTVTRQGIFNFIHTSKAEPISILKSFDINATLAGYSIDEDKAYFLPEFVDFLQTRKLKVTNLGTPAHTALRLAKKSQELNSPIDEIEFRMLQFCIQNSSICSDFNRFRFQKKYAHLYLKHKHLLDKYFTLEADTIIIDWLSKFRSVETNIWKLRVVQDDEFKKFNEKLTILARNTRFVLTTNDILTFFRHVLPNDVLQPIWKELKPFFIIPNYVDTTSEEEINKIIKFTKTFPGCIKNLTGLTLTQQNKLIFKTIDTIGRMFDIETAACVLEKYKLSPETRLTEFESQLLGLNVRKMRSKFSKQYEELPF